MAILHPQECWLLERAMSVEYYRKRYEAWRALVELCEYQVAEWAKSMPLDIRRRPLYEQIDAVWGGRVLPNIRGTLKSVHYDFLQRQQNDPNALHSGGNISSDRRGLIDYFPNWMPDVAQKQYQKLLWRAGFYDDLIKDTSTGYWYEGSLTYYYEESLYGPLALPMQLPLYELDHSVYLREGDPVTIDGLYLPDLLDAGARLMYLRENNPDAWQGRVRTQYVNDVGQQEYYWEEGAWTKTNWIRIRRVKNRFINVPLEGFFPRGTPEELYNWPQRQQQYITEQQRISASSGEPCPHGGEWSIFVEDKPVTVTLEQGELMPEWEDRTMEEEHKQGEKFHVLWSLMARHDGGPVWVSEAG
ncbi:hypothetical protein [Klebsiella pneumoniae]|uniref:hypothetical protein n=1 Tax=Klebsiella pneumoniae TaxID=573 RepID=UPI00124B26B2|nr:hypothetical protein [Klebsiella pneumoniae]KAB1804371.1 hypothetical protein FXO00_12470 [Klebsiella pneumoniae]MBV7443116.1 hypothetical protein [Klebsiella pneumoniae]HCJ2202820.1 hypothetical protein [Klebsiella pneumoniae]